MLVSEVAGLSLVVFVSGLKPQARKSALVLMLCWLETPNYQRGALLRVNENEEMSARRHLCSAALRRQLFKAHQQNATSLWSVGPRASKSMVATLKSWLETHCVQGLATRPTVALGDERPCRVGCMVFKCEEDLMMSAYDPRSPVLVF